MTGASDDVTNRLTVANDGESPLEFVLEPWGEIYELPAGESFEIVAHGPPGGFEVTHQAGRIVVWGWTGTTVDLLRDNVEIAPGSGPRGRVPPMP